MTSDGGFDMAEDSDADDIAGLADQLIMARYVPR
jgi:hypothetical protein